MTSDRQTGSFFGRGLLPHWQAVGLVFIALSMPLLLPGFGWLYAFVPLPAFYYLVVEGEKKGLQIIGWAAMLTGAGAIAVHGFAFFLFTASFLAVSFSLTRSLRLHQDPAAAGIRACAALFAAWVLFAAGYGLLHKSSLYADLLTSIDRGVKEAYPVYMKSTELSDSLKQQISTTFDTVRQTLPKVLPALLVLWLITTVWLTMTLGAHLIRKRRPACMTWPPYSDWRLPDVAVWLVIASGTMLFLPVGDVRLYGLNGLMVCAVLYFFQGLAVLGTLFNRWRVPPVVRILIYVLTIMQMYGLLFLSVLGLVDVWADFKKPRGKATM